MSRGGHLLRVIPQYELECCPAIWTSRGELLYRCDRLGETCSKSTLACDPTFSVPLCWYRCRSMLHIIGGLVTFGGNRMTGQFEWSIAIAECQHDAAGQREVSAAMLLGCRSSVRFKADAVEYCSKELRGSTDQILSSSPAWAGQVW